MTISEEINNIMDGYWKWLKESTCLHEISNNYLCIVTPFLDRHNDNFQIYVTKHDNGYKLTDDGYVISDLQLSGCDINSEKRKQFVTGIVRSFGIEMESNCLYTITNESDFPSKKHDLIQAMMAISDIYYTSKSNVVSLFLEEVSSWLMKSKIPSTSGMNIHGRTYNHHVDFTLPDKTVNGPKRLLQVMDKPGKDKVANMLLMKTDIQEDLQMFVLINDSGSNTKTVEQVKKATTENGMIPILWSQRDESIKLLA